MFVIALNSMLSLFVCMVVGFVGIRKGFLKNEMLGSFNKLLLSVTVPAMMIDSLNVTMNPELLTNGIISIIVGFIYHLGVIVFALIVVKVFKIDVELRSLWIFGLSFANVAYLGFPLLNDLFGESAVFYASLFNISFSVIVFTLGIILINGKSNVSVKTLLTNPPLIGVFIGLVLLVLPISMPEFLDKSVSMIGSMTAPLSMIIVGATLASTNAVKALKNGSLYAFSLLKLIIIPLLVYIIGICLINDQNLVIIFTVLAGTPSATLTVVLAKEYNKNSLFASEIVFVTTMLSVITLPLIINLITNIL